MSFLEEFHEVLKRDEPLAPYTWMKLGGPAQYFLEPRSVPELVAIVKACAAQKVAIRVLGGGSNLLVREEGVSGAVIKLTHEAFQTVSIDGNKLTTGGGALLSNAISQAVKAGLAGFENLAGIPGTIGGALRGNAGGRNGDIGQYVQSVKVLTVDGEILDRSDDELSFGYRQSNLTELVILEATFQLAADNPDEIIRRLRKTWIMKKSSQPLAAQSAGCIFKNPRGLSAGSLIDQASLKGTRVGGAEISDRHANFVVSDGKATSSDVLRLMDLVRSKVSEQFAVDLEPEIQIW
ncbi:MAG: UDP-N-acetylenolpyruvoylglucosamine reductase [Planctomyces sp.]|jgi:UDP-N-acetylmuramate dehydrogenase|nr:UDP-N-acetylenolpyruvoylglucosamine reductase [Planctomyces sp.]